MSLSCNELLVMSQVAGWIRQVSDMKPGFENKWPTSERQETRLDDEWCLRWATRNSVKWARWLGDPSDLEPDGWPNGYLILLLILLVTLLVSWVTGKRWGARGYRWKATFFLLSETRELEQQKGKNYANRSPRPIQPQRSSHKRRPQPPRASTSSRCCCQALCQPENGHHLWARQVPHGHL